MGDTIFIKRRNGFGVTETETTQPEEIHGRFTDMFNNNKHKEVPLLERSAPFRNNIFVSKG